MISFMTCENEIAGAQTVACDTHLAFGRFQQFGADLLIEFVIVHQEHMHLLLLIDLNQSLKWPYAMAAEINFYRDTLGLF